MRSNGEYNVLKARASELPNYGNEDLLDEEYDEDYQGGDDEFDVEAMSTAAESVGYKSVSFAAGICGAVGKVGKAIHKVIAPFLFTKHGVVTQKIVLPCMVEYWKDSKCRNRASIQIQCLSGDNPHEISYSRLSSLQTEYIYTTPMADPFMTPEGSFNSHVLNTEAVQSDASGGLFRLLSSVLEFHTKSISRRSNVAVLKGRDAQKQKVMLEFRVPLDGKYQHRFVTKQEDEYFYGSKFVQGEKGEVFHHAELIQEMKDGYSPMKDAASVRSARDFNFLPNNGGGGFMGVPTNITIKTDDDDDSSFKPSASRASRKDDYDDMSVDEWMNNFSLAEESNYASGSVAGGSVSSKQSFISTCITKSKKGKSKNRVAAAASVAAATSPRSQFSSRTGMSLRSTKSLKKAPQSPPKKRKTEKEDEALQVETVNSKDTEEEEEEKEHNLKTPKD
mmetsp:Transcript_8243/g.20743  ORF Transcript_8243/g.20743 Transcript_8243/m.20743 type:complete len:448 (+) Transcript_8243:215-1558(+)|eukprot:CAMPEP_0113463408 /NCGR_PEP_ID=MMETSP0014_2-20120614/12633_1 /TAXON_ID=2857 /ORGANISM="Nitzschia sp." /LENGTH=447 /DNA_ID=CAMNT_0000355383 /DNA_START=422 /DNA_END=1765 /DNA_ORIENTATION=- /assembly_acc=CAM_ASM_000159